MDQRTNRTFICSVLFVDIVEYSVKSVEEQIWLKERFNALLAEAIQDVAVNDRILLDTGDGAAIGFLGDPEDALFVAMGMRDAAMNERRDESLCLSLRMGINLGPVKLVRDINQQVNLIGDGINVAQRIMSFADPGRLLVSRSYYEVVSCLSQEFAKLFSYEGMHADKHIRQHRIYAVGNASLKRPSASAAPQPPKAVFTPDEGALADLQQPGKGGPAEAQATGDILAATFSAWLRLFSRIPRKWIYAAVPLILVISLIAVFALRGGKDPAESQGKARVTAAASKSSGKSPGSSAGKRSEGSGSAAPAPLSPDAYKKLSVVGFTLSEADRKGRDLTLTLKLKNSAKDSRSVALYDASYSWTKSHLIVDGGRSYDVEEVYYRKNGKKITMRDTGKTGIPVGGGATVSIYLVFRNLPDGLRKATLNLHPFIYHGRNWTEHDTNFPDVILG